MKTGSSFWRGNMIYRNAFQISLLFVLLCIAPVLAQATELPSLTWSDRITIENADGSLVETPPSVQIGGVSLSRFTRMQNVALEQSLTLVEEETIFVFRVWQGGASQGEQLMLVTLSKEGADVVGPHPADFETLKILPQSGDLGPVFEVFGSDPSVPVARLEYFDGQLLELN